MHRELISYLPPKLRDKVIYKEVCNAEENEFKLLFSNIDYMANDIFISDLTLEGVKRWEKDLKINHFDTDTLEDRRFRILNRFLNKLPYTMRTLENTLDTLVGKGGYQLNFNNETYTLSISINLTVKSQLEEVKRTLYYMVPANIVQDIQLLYNSHKTLSQYTHQQLSVYTHKQLREDMLYKYVFYNGSMITALNCLEGQVKGIEILGNTIQNPENLADIKSSGILQSDGKYKYTLNVCGKNFNNTTNEIGAIDWNTGVNITSSELYRSKDFIRVYSNINIYCNIVGGGIIQYDKNKNFITSNQNVTNIFTNSNTRYIKYVTTNNTNIQLEEGTVATEYEPYKGNKVDIFLPCQLEKVGDLEDRLYFDEKEMSWCVVDNTVDYKFSDVDVVNIYSGEPSPNCKKYKIKFDYDKQNMVRSNNANNLISSKFTPRTTVWWTSSSNNIGTHDIENNIFITTPNDIDTVEKAKEYIKDVKIKYRAKSPQKIILPQSTQIQLNSFHGTNHMWLDSGEVTGTFKAGIKTK